MYALLPAPDERTPYSNLYDAAVAAEAEVVAGGEVGSDARAGLADGLLFCECEREEEAVCSSGLSRFQRSSTLLRFAADARGVPAGLASFSVAASTVGGAGVGALEPKRGLALDRGGLKTPGKRLDEFALTLGLVAGEPDADAEGGDAAPCCSPHASRCLTRFEPFSRVRDGVGCLPMGSLLDPNSEKRLAAPPIGAGDDLVMDAACGLLDAAEGAGAEEAGLLDALELDGLEYDGFLAAIGGLLDAEVCSWLFAASDALASSGAGLT